MHQIADAGQFPFRADAEHGDVLRRAASGVEEPAVRARSQRNIVARSARGKGRARNRSEGPRVGVNHEAADVPAPGVRGVQQASHHPDAVGGKKQEIRLIAAVPARQERRAGHLCQCPIFPTANPVTCSGLSGCWYTQNFFAPSPLGRETRPKRERKTSAASYGPPSFSARRMSECHRL